MSLIKEETEMSRINRKEYEVLKGLDDKWKTIVRISLGWLVITEENPTKGETTWEHNGPIKTFPDYVNNLFQFIQWEDEEPHNIAELIEEYEDSKEYTDSLLIKYFIDKAKESEEIE